MTRIRLLIASDHELLRFELKQLIEKQSDIDVVGEAKNGLEVVVKAQRLQPDIVLVDISMPLLSGLEAIGLVKKVAPSSQVVLLSMHKENAYVYQALNSGASGYVLKATAATDVLDAIRTVNRGDYFLSSWINDQLINTYLKSYGKKTVKKSRYPSKSLNKPLLRSYEEEACLEMDIDMAIAAMPAPMWAGMIKNG